MTKVVHIRKPHDIYIGRGSKWGNPFKVGIDGSRKEVIEKYEQWIKRQNRLLEQLYELRSKVLGCFCKPLSCHGDVLVKLVEERYGSCYKE